MKKAIKLTFQEKKDIKEFCTSTIIHPVEYVGSGRFITKRDRSFNIISVLKRLGYKYSEGNDAPRGGANGNYIKVSKTALNKLNELAS